jgi:hypothetical protein
MAKVVIQFDTNDKTLNVTVDGKSLENVVHADVCRRDYYGYGMPVSDDDEDEPEFRFCITQAEKDADNDTEKVTRIVAADSEEGKLSTAQVIDELPSCRAVASSRVGDGKAVSDIVGYFSDE